MLWATRATVAFPRTLYITRIRCWAPGLLSFLVSYWTLSIRWAAELHKRAGRATECRSQVRKCRSRTYGSSSLASELLHTNYGEHPAEYKIAASHRTNKKDRQT